MAADDIKAIEEEIKNTKYNKATQKHIGILKAKLARLRLEEAKRSAGKAGVGYGVKKRGDATILLVGFPSVGKSTLLNRITSADSKVGEYEFTTLDVIPGMLEYNSAQIQVLDVPGIIEGVSSGKGRGRSILSVVRIADLILIMVDARKPEQLEIIRRELHQAGFRLDQRPPEIKITRKERGGIQIGAPKKLGIKPDSIKAILNEFNFYNGEIIIRERVDLDQIVDALARNLVYVPSLVVANKSDAVDELPGGMLGISALKGTNLEKLKEAIWSKLGLIRVYLKKIGKPPDLEEPLIMREGCTIRDVCVKIHKEFSRNFRYARRWGKSAKFEGQMVGAKHRLLDGDIVELHID